MNNPNTPINKLKAYLKKRWSAEDYPGAAPRFQFELFAKDVGIFMFLPVLSIIIVKSCEGSNDPNSNRKRVERSSDAQYMEQSTSQIINFQTRGSKSPLDGVPKRAPGALVKVRLMNVVETFGNVPVHAQIVDAGLGKLFVGGTLIGEATPDSGFERINISFKYAKPAYKQNLAYNISARALGLDGTLGLNAKKKEGYFARAAISAAETASQNAKGSGNEKSLRDFLIQALTSGLGQEFNQSVQIEKNRAQVLTLQTSQEFLVELTDYFPGAN